MMLFEIFQMQKVRKIELFLDEEDRQVNSCNDEH